MKPFKQFSEENKQKKQESHYVDKKGRVVLLHALGERLPHERVEKKKDKKKVSEDWKTSHYFDADKNISPKHGDEGLDTDAGDPEELSDILSRTQKEPSEEHKKHLNNYTKNSRVLNKSLIKAHQEYDELGFEHPEGIRSRLEEQHGALMANTHAPLRHVHLYSGTDHDFSDIAKSSKDGIIHSPAHISASHDIHVATEFSRRKSDMDSLSRAASGEHATGHMVHINVKPHQKIIHMSHHSEYPGEHETLIPSGTNLKYSHTTEHYAKEKPQEQGSPKMKIKIHHFDIHDNWHKDPE